MYYRRSYLMVSLWMLVFSYGYAQHSTLKPVADSYYKNGLVVSAHPEASRVGLDILKNGGNAVDAAVAVQFALAVVYPNAGNLGGGGFLVYRSSDGQASTLDYREKAPLAATRDMYLDSAGNAVVDRSLVGHLAAGVPGTVAGMTAVHKRFGKLKWDELLQPAIDLAANGFKITAQQASELNNYKDIFIANNPLGTALLRSEKWQAGQVLQQTELAYTLKLIRDKGKNGFYRGAVAELIVEEMKRGSGIISKKDLKSYKAKWRVPVQTNYKDYKVITMGPPSSGGIALAQLLQAVEPFPIAKWKHNRDSTVRVIVEAERRVYADRATHLGDPDFYNVPQAQLLEPSYQARRMSDMDWNYATSSSSIKAGIMTGEESEQTTHFSIVDKDGNAVSNTTTLNGSYGAKVLVKGAGFLLNNEMDDFSVKPGSPNMYGLIGGEANAIAPSKRMLSCMTPTILEKGGKLFMVVGTPGGSTIITSVFQTILNVVEFGKSMQSAVSAPRFHHQWLPDEIAAEEGAFDEATLKIIRAKGYKVVKRSAIGRVDAILVTDSGYQAGADPRGDDKAEGY